MSKQKNNISKAVYAIRKSILSKIMNFSFKTRSNFTPAQKSAITRAWNKYDNYIKSMQRGHARFVKADKSQLKQLKTEFFTTNKGVIYYDLNVDKKVSIKGHGKSTILTTEYQSRKEVFIPKPKYVPFVVFVLKLLRDNETSMDKFDEISLAVDGHHGRSRFTPEQMVKYLKREIEEAIAAYRAKRRKHPFNGVYVSYYKRIKTTKKRKVVKKKAVKKKAVRRGKKTITASNGRF